MTRFLKIVVPGLLIFILVAIIGVYIFLQTNAFNSWIRSEITAWLETNFQVTVELRSVSSHIFGGILVLEGLRINGLESPASDPDIEIERIELNFSVLQYLSPSVRLDRIDVTRPKLRIEADLNGRLNLSKMFHGLPGDKPEGSDENRSSIGGLSIGAIIIRDGVLIWRDQALSFESASHNLELRTEFQSADHSYLGNLKLGELTFSTAEHALPPCTISADFRLKLDELILDPISLSSGFLQVEARGNLTEFQEPWYRFEVRAVGDLQATPSTLLPEIFEEGEITAVGALSGQGGDFNFEGTIEADELLLPWLSVNSLTAGVEADHTSLRVSAASCRALGSQVGATGELFWDISSQSMFSASTDSLQVKPILARLGLANLPVEGTGGAGVEFEWPGLRVTDFLGRGSARLSAALLPAVEPSDRDSGFSPLRFDGELAFQLGPERAVIETARFRSVYSTITGSGFLFYSGDHDLSLDAGSLSDTELKILAGRLGLLASSTRASYPVGFRGLLQTKIHLIRQAGIQRLEGIVETDQLTYESSPLGRFEAGVSTSGDAILVEHLELIGPDYRLSLAADIPLGFWEPDFPFQANVQLREVPISAFRKVFADSQLDVKGRVTGAFGLERLEADHFLGRGTLTLPRVEGWGVTAEQLECKLEVSEQELVISDLGAKIAGGYATGFASYDFKSGSYNLQSTARGVRLEELQPVQGTSGLSGPVSLVFEGTGPRNDFRYKVQIESPEVLLGAHTVRGLNIRSEGLKDQNRLQLNGRFLDSPIEADGTLQLTSPFPFEAKAVVRGLSLEKAYHQYTGTELEGLTGRTSALVTAQGELSDFGSMKILVDLENIDIRPDGARRVQSQTPARLEYEKGTFRLSEMELVGVDSRLSLRGDLVLGEIHRINLSLNGETDLQILNPLLETGSVGGKATVELNALGPLDNPRLVGSLELKEGSLVHPDLPIPVSDAQGVFRFTTNQVAIEGLRILTPYGAADLEGGIFLEGLRPARWQINLSGSGMQLEYPEDVFSILDADLDFIKSEKGQLVSGVVYVRSAEYSRQISLRELILRFSGPASASPTTRQEGQLVLDIDVEAYRSLIIDNNLADIVASATLDLGGTVDHPVLLGRMNIDSGRLFLARNEYDVITGSISFDNPRETTPYFNLEAVTEVRDYAVTVLARGPLDQLQMTLRSDPPVATASIVSLLAAGQTSDELVGTESSGRTQGSALALYGAGALLSSTVESAIQPETSRLFGFEKFYIDPFVDTGGDRDPGARITIGKQITRDLNVTFITSLGSELRGQATVIQYRVTDWVTLVGTGQEDGSISFDLKFRKRF
jgi:hypothetical protein